MLENREEVSPPVVRRSITLGGVREAIQLLILFAVLSSVGVIFRPLLLFAAIALLVYGYVRLCFRFGQRVGIAGIAVLGIAGISAAAVQYGYHLRYEKLLETLRTYDSVTIRQANIFPSSDVIQVSFEGNITDEEIAAIATMAPLKNVTHVFIKQCQATDQALESLDVFQRLSYVFIESEIITDSAITDFEEQHPGCTVIPYGRK